MANWNELPLEVLIKIFDLTVDSYWVRWERSKEYLLISRRWSIASRVAVFKNVRLRMDHFDAFADSMISSNNGQFVKHLLWKNIPDPDILEANLDRLLEACPNVTNLGIGMAEAVNESFFTKLLLVHCTSKNGFRLKHIPRHFDETDNGVRTYKKLAYALRKTLKHVQVYDWPRALGEGFMDETANSLVEFENLKRISFHFKDHDNIYQVGLKIRNCPTIKHVMIFPSQVTCNMQARTTMPIEPSTIHPLPNIDNLCIFNAKVAIGSGFLEFVMRSFPKLRYLAIAEGEPQPDGEMTIPVVAIPYLQQRGQRVSVELWIQFFNYLNTLEACSVSTMFIKDYLNVFAHFPTFCDSLEIIHGRDQVSGIAPYISVYNNSDESYYIKDRHIDYSTSRRTLVYLPPDVNRTSVNFKALVGIFENTLKALRIGMDTFTRDGQQQEMLCYALEHCPVLNTLWISKGMFSHFGSNTFMKNESLEYLRFTNCVFRNDFLCELSGRLCNKIEILVFIDCILDQDWDESFVTIDMPYTMLGYLVWKNHFIDRDEKIVFLKITKNHGMCSYYKVSPGPEMTVSSSVDFYAAKDNDTIFNMHIRCFDIKALMMNKMNSNFILDFTDPVKVGPIGVYSDEHTEIFNEL